MNYRTCGRTGWRISEIGCGTWGMGGWSGSDKEESLRSLNLAVELGCNFFDTAYAYGEGYSERLLGDLLQQQPDKKLYVATKVPPKNRQWPSKRGSRLADVFPPEHIREMTEKSLENLKLDCLDMEQFHVWEDSWAQDERWQRAVDDLKHDGMPEMALRWILAHQDVTTVIPGMRREEHVRANIAASDGRQLSPDLMQELRRHRWDRTPTEWSQ